MLSCLVYYCLELHHRNISYWKVLSVTRHLSGRNTFPAMLKAFQLEPRMQRKMGLTWLVLGIYFHSFSRNWEVCVFCHAWTQVPGSHRCMTRCQWCYWPHFQQCQSACWRTHNASWWEVVHQLCLRLCEPSLLLSHCGLLPLPSWWDQILTDTFCLCAPLQLKSWNQYRRRQECVVCFIWWQPFLHWCF